MSKTYIKAFTMLILIISICFSYAISSVAFVRQVYIYDGTTITQLTDNADHDSGPQINDSGEVVWQTSSAGPLFPR